MGLKQRRRPRARQPAEAQHAASPASNYQARVTPIRHISIPKAQRIALYPLGDTPALSSNLIANNRLTLLNELLNLGLVFNDADEGAKGYISHSLPKFVDSDRARGQVQEPMDPDPVLVLETARPGLVIDRWLVRRSVPVLADSSHSDDPDFVLVHEKCVVVGREPPQLLPESVRAAGGGEPVLDQDWIAPFAAE